jgi:hypothetical protein
MRDPTLLGGGDWTTWLAVSGALTFPASPQSKRAGLDLATGLHLAVRQQIKLLGSDAPGLTHLLLGAGIGWSHPFRSLPDFIPGVQPASEDQLSYSFDMLVALYGDLQLRSGVDLIHTIQTYDEPGSSCEVITVNEGCVDIEPANGGSRTAYFALFSVDLAYLIIPELAVDVGYSNLGLTIGADGNRRGLFYGPSASFNAGLTLSIDRLIQRITAPRMSEGAAPAPVAHLQ